MVSSVEDFGVSPMQEIFSTNSNGQSSGRFWGQFNEKICPVEDQEGSFLWKSLSPEWLPKLIIPQFEKKYLCTNKYRVHVSP